MVKSKDYISTEKQMTISFFKSRCLVCWKDFRVPLLPDSSYGENLYYDKKTKKFYYFNWFDNKEIENCVTEFLSKNQKFKSLNNKTKGNTALQIVGFIANGNKEYVVGYNRCPRCKLKFNFVSDTRTNTDSIEILNFTNFLNLDNSNQQQYIFDKIRNQL